MQLTLLKLKLYNLCVSAAELEYEGSIGLVAAAHMAEPGDRVIVAAFAGMTADAAKEGGRASSSLATGIVSSKPAVARRVNSKRPLSLRPPWTTSSPYRTSPMTKSRPSSTARASCCR
jgi:hypothetical protein